MEKQMLKIMLESVLKTLIKKDEDIKDIKFIKNGKKLSEIKIIL